MSFSALSFEDCRKIKDINILSEYMHMDYLLKDGDYKLTNKEKRMGHLFETWSEVAGSLYKVYFESGNPEWRVNKVKIEYIYKKKKMYSKMYKLKKKKKKNIFEIMNFTFDDGVMDKQYRPGQQVYKFYYNDKEVCETTTRHIYVEEY
jgi:hypothetical protein